ncbi:hypothetical protein QEJ31_04245 [Pigmentibacter sp. JX0631]|uniref:hypothetical protein n=1 Tax=Pigmentibacter sp. JX0631 TaxID=2976982 RepID=UPI00246993A0|nr:hypothetical protein [Pigmentibacter sp. JX0631]WGL60806.1 hypothetical protein QEJ31_04245 [Pigmentibacter sp. JX0631]
MNKINFIKINSISKVFLIGLLLRLFCLSYDNTLYLSKYFIPFIDWSILHPFENPWKEFPPVYFPYGSFIYLSLLLSKAFGYLIFGASSLGDTVLSNIFIKAPLFLFDILLYKVIEKFTHSNKNINYFYWLNPIVIYVTYILGSIDIVSMSLCFLSLLLLVRKQYIASSIVLSLACLSKFHIFIIYPFMLAYIYRSNFLSTSILKITKSILVFLIILFIGLIPILQSGHLLYVSFASPQALSIFSLAYKIDDSSYLFYGLLFLSIILYRLVFSANINERGLIFGSSIIFSLLIIITPPVANWYIWLVPFYCIFFIMYSNSPKKLYYLFIATYTVKFIILSHFKNTPIIMNSFLITALQSIVILIAIYMWILVIIHDCPIGKKIKPIVIGISGNSAAGKNTLSFVISKLFEQKALTVIDGDDYHKWERGNERWEKITHLDPKANNLHYLFTHLTNIFRGRSIYKTFYDHSNGKFTPFKEVRSSPAIVLQGLHIFYQAKLRRYIDIKIFLDPSDEIILYWKINRDVNERNYKLNDVLKSIERRYEDTKKYITPQKQYADWIINYFPLHEISREEILAGKKPILAVKHILYNDFPSDELSHALLSSCNVEIKVNSFQNDINKIEITILQEPSAHDIYKASIVLFDNLPSLLRLSHPPKWSSGFQGINQLIFLILINKSYM